MRHNNPYIRGKLDGMSLALSLAEQEGGLERLRDALSSGTAADMRGEMDSIMARALKRIFVVSVAAIHDAYGVGPKRMEKYFESFDEATRLLMKGRDGGALLEDYSREIRKRYGVILSANARGILILHPDPEEEGPSGSRASPAGTAQIERGDHGLGKPPPM